LRGGDGGSSEVGRVVGGGGEFESDDASAFIGVVATDAHVRRAEPEGFFVGGVDGHEGVVTPTVIRRLVGYAVSDDGFIDIEGACAISVRSCGLSCEAEAWIDGC